MLTQNPIIRPPGNAARSIGRYGMDRAVLYSAAMGVREIARLTTQKVRPPAIVSFDACFQTYFDWVIFFFSFSFAEILFLILRAPDQEPQRESKFRNDAKRIADIGDCRKAWNEEELKRSHQPGAAMDHQHDAQDLGKEARLEDRISQWKEPGGIKYLGDHEPVLVQIQE